jgi:hypothetical protein
MGLASAVPASTEPAARAAASVPVFTKFILIWLQVSGVRPNLWPRWRQSKKQAILIFCIRIKRLQRFSKGRHACM